MCTVSLIPLGDSDFVLTSNRDEAPERETLDPNFYTEKGVRLLYPKDKMAGGTWIGLSDKNRLICLLNGGFTQHSRKDNYRLSRGVVVKDLLTSNNVFKTIEDYNLNNIEPFTIVLVDWSENLNFYELVWDGSKKHFKELPLEPKIWSSSTLYNKQMKDSRLEWFEDYKANNELNSKSILNFHKTAGKENKDYGVIMDRVFVKTTSITQIEKHHLNLEMDFFNLQKSTISKSNFSLSEPIND